jgi:hypothetical protein
MGSGASSVQDEKIVLITRKGNLCEGPKWSHQVGDPIPEHLAPYLSKQLWDELLADIAVCDNPMRYTNWTMIFGMILFFVFLAIQPVFFIGIIILVITIIYWQHAYGVYKYNMIKLVDKHGPKFKDFAEFKRKEIRSGSDNKNNVYAFQFKLHPADKLPPPLTTTAAATTTTTTTMNISYPPPTVSSSLPSETLSVTIPQGVTGGQIISVQAPNGTQISVQVPLGMQPGQIMNVQVPAPTQPTVMHVEAVLVQQ